MGKAVRKSNKPDLKDVKAAIAFNQPKLSAARDGANIKVHGTYLLYENGTDADPLGPLSEFDIEIILPHRYPSQEPKVFEVGGRIPRCVDRHINHDGDCCLTVWEEWLVRADDTSFPAFMDGPLREFFLGQYWFECTGNWPFGERSHGEKGLLEAFSDVLGINNHEKKDVIYYLRLLKQPWPKGHCLCPCGSGKRLRHCHQKELMALHRKIPPSLAKKMLSRFDFSRTDLNMD